MTSPVDFISGPSTVSTLSPKRAKGKTASLMPTCVAAPGSKRCGLRWKLFQGFARHDSRGNLGAGDAGHLGDERHRARGARIDLEHVNVAILDGVCTFISPPTLSAMASARVCRSSSAIVSAERLCGGSEQAESPEWMPASSMCSMMPAM